MDVACYYIGFGNASYRELASWMVYSAKRHIPFVRLIHLTDKYTPKLEGFDVVIRCEENIAHDQLALGKGAMIAECAAQAKTNTVFVDPDIVFNKDINGIFDGTFDVGLLFRNGAPHKSFNGGLIVTTPGQWKFWNRIAEANGKMFYEAQAWWSEQVAMAVILGIDHEPGSIVESNGSRVKLLDMVKTAPKPAGIPLTRLETYAVHFTGDQRKQWIKQYLDL